jgi:hypothetical protein
MYPTPGTARGCGKDFDPVWPLGSRLVGRTGTRTCPFGVDSESWSLRPDGQDVTSTANRSQDVRPDGLKEGRPCLDHGCQILRLFGSLAEYLYKQTCAQWSEIQRAPTKERQSRRVVERLEPFIAGARECLIKCNGLRRFIVEGMSAALSAANRL